MDRGDKGALVTGVVGVASGAASVMLPMAFPAAPVVVWQVGFWVSCAVVAGALLYSLWDHVLAPTAARRWPKLKGKPTPAPKYPVVRVTRETATNELATRLAIPLHLTLVNSEAESFDIGQCTGQIRLHYLDNGQKQVARLATPQVIAKRRLEAKGMAHITLLQHFTTDQVRIMRECWRVEPKRVNLEFEELKIALVDQRGKTYTLELPDGVHLNRRGSDITVVRNTIVRVGSAHMTAVVSMSATGTVIRRAGWWWRRWLPKSVRKRLP